MNHFSSVLDCFPKFVAVLLGAGLLGGCGMKLESGAVVSVSGKTDSTAPLESDSAPDTAAIDTSDTKFDTVFGGEDETDDTDSMYTWFRDSTIAKRSVLPVPGSSTLLSAKQIVEQLPVYDPGSALRCDVGQTEEYAAASNALGGTRWGYSVAQLEDLSAPIFQNGLPEIDSKDDGLVLISSPVYHWSPSLCPTSWVSAMTPHCFQRVTMACWS